MQTDREGLEPIGNESLDPARHAPDAELLFLRSVAEGAIGEVRELCERRLFADLSARVPLCGDPVKI